MVVITLIFIGILIYTALEELNITSDAIQGGVIMLEQWFPYIIIIGAIYFLARGFMGSSGKSNSTGGRSSRGGRGNSNRGE